MAKIILDAFAWVEFLDGTPTGGRVRDLITASSESYTLDTTLAEVARKYLREGTTKPEVESYLRRMGMLSSIRAIDPRIAVEAATADAELRAKAKEEKGPTPSLFDSVVLAAARVLGAQVVTGDQHFAGLAETRWIGVTPAGERPSLLR